MTEKIRIHVNKLFEKAPNTKRANDLKEEIISNANDKYIDLIKEGKSEEVAYENVIKGIGNTDELIEELNKNNPINSSFSEERRKKSAFIVAICVGLYILSIILVIILDELNLPEFITASSFLGIAGISTCIIIYHFMSRPKYIKYEDTMVEEFKEWKNQKSQNNEVKKAIHSILWTLTVAIYLLISFIFGIWYISWIIFILAAVVGNIIDLSFKLKELK